MGRAFEYRRAAKEKRWGMMSRVFPKLAKAITMAAKQGGDDPSTNSTLRAAIKNAKAQNMPKDNIDKAIKTLNRLKAYSFSQAAVSRNNKIIAIEARGFVIGAPLAGFKIL